jgi:hypothetical protein
MFVEDKPLTLPCTYPAEPRTGGDVLLAAARFIEEHGWSPNGHKQAQDLYCPVEAISEVTSEQRIRDEAYRLLRDRTGMYVTRWNAGSTEDEVIATMRVVALANEQDK